MLTPLLHTFKAWNSKFNDKYWFLDFNFAMFNSQNDVPNT